MPANATQAWSAAADTELKYQLSQTDISGQVIANRMSLAMGRPFTRSMVIARARRMGLDLPGAKPSRKVIHAYPTVREKPPKPQWKEKPVKPMPEMICEPVSKHLILDQLKADSCRWPYGDRDFTFCGHQAVEGKAYCTYHRLRSAHGSSFALAIRPDLAQKEARPPV